MVLGIMSDFLLKTGPFGYYVMQFWILFKSYVSVSLLWSSSGGGRWAPPHYCWKSRVSTCLHWNPVGGTSHYWWMGWEFELSLRPTLIPAWLVWEECLLCSLLTTQSPLTGSGWEEASVPLSGGESPGWTNPSLTLPHSGVGFSLPLGGCGFSLDTRTLGSGKTGVFLLSLLRHPLPLGWREVLGHLVIVWSISQHSPERQNQ